MNRDVIYLLYEVGQVAMEGWLLTLFYDPNEKYHAPKSSVAREVFRYDPLPPEFNLQPSLSRGRKNIKKQVIWAYFSTSSQPCYIKSTYSKELC